MDGFTGEPIEEEDKPKFEDYLPTIKNKLKRLSNWKAEARLRFKELDARVQLLEKKANRCPHCGKEL